MKPLVRYKLHHVAIQTAHFDKAFHFYAEVLGMRVIKQPYRFKERKLAWLDAGAILVELYSVKNGKEPQPYDTRRVGADHIAFEVDDLDQFLQYLGENDVPILKPPFRPPSDDPDQPAIAFIAGVDGEEIEVRQAVFTDNGDFHDEDQ